MYTPLSLICTGLLLTKEKTSLNGFSSIYLVLNPEVLTICVKFVRPTHSKRWNEQRVNKLNLITVEYEKKQKYIVCRTNRNRIYSSVNKTQMLIINTIFRWGM